MMNQKRIARIAYNTEGWIKPSGKYGKSENKDSFECIEGFGNEEWLFDLAKTYKDYHYAFLEPVRKEPQAYEGKTFDVALFTINGKSKQRFYIGDILGVEVISETQAKEAHQFYKKQGWLDEMGEQVLEVANKKFSDWEGVFNIRFKISGVKQSESSNIPIPVDNPIYSLNRYSFAYYKEEYGLTDNISKADSYNYDAAKDSQPSIGSSSTKKGKYERSPKTVEIEYLHQAINDRLLMKQKSEGKDVKKEVPAGYGNNRIDMVEHDSDGDIFYEIKTYPSLKTSIRMAIGQLLEYSMWTEQNKAKELIIVTQPTADIEEARAYFAHIRKLYNIPLYYQSFNVETNELSEKV
ncbi:hypothetical protein EZS27_019560 [termite gut metagenome]|uniref:Uncharacterized protein n=1 Tax=termite gut metagenome TaxID=433724 RepID=A0A5J4RDU1_9ZZZZ